MKRIITALVLAAAVATVSAAESDGAWRQKVDPWVIDTTAGGRTTEFIVHLREQADLRDAERLRSKEARGRYVYERLTEVARRTQGPVIAALEAHGVEYRSYWVTNMIWVRGDLSVARAMAERADVQGVRANPAVRLVEPTPVLSDVDSPEAIEPNIIQVGAPDVFWAAGIRGEGVVVAGQDTGYDWDHPALKNQYRGWNGVTADHNYNWHDAIHSGGGICGPNSPEPCDDNSHGTHTMGTMVGDDGGSNQIGMAPGARWIGCRNMNQGVGTPITYAECFQWFIAPTDLNDQNPDPTKAPHVINNSWSCPVSEGCTDPNVLREVVENVRAAGIVVVQSAGNSGSGCSTVNTPAAIYDASFSVGSVNSADNISSFSSRGPVTVDGSQRMKPDVSAPGENIRSSVPGGGYSRFSGTSMAGPHVVGLIALAASAQSCLQGDVDALEQYVKAHVLPKTSTQTCGGIPGSTIPNNTYGYGVIRSALPTPSECKAEIGGGTGGLQSAMAACTNRNTGQAVGAAVDAALSWSCEDAGLTAQRGNVIIMRVTGPAKVPLIESTSTGVRSLLARCVNTTTGQAVNIPLGGGTSWSCTAAGLTVSPGDTVNQTIISVAN
jgi:subtilisin family serine protease